MSRAKRIVNKLLETGVDEPTPENIQHLAPILPVEEAWEVIKRRLGLKRGFWQFYKPGEGEEQILFTGYAEQFRTSGEAYRALLGVIAQWKLPITDFQFNEDDHQFDALIPKHFFQCPEPRTDDFDEGELQ